MSTNVLSRTASTCLKQVKAKSVLISQLRTVAELSNGEANSKPNESLDLAQSKYSLLNEKSLSRQVLDHARFKTIKTLETKTHGDREFEVIQIKFRNWIVCDEKREFVNDLIDCLGKQLNVDREEAKRYFFNLNSLRNVELENLFGRAGALERNFRAAKLYLSGDQLIRNDFELLKNFQRRFLNRMSILKLIGMPVPSTLNQLNFAMIISQTEETLKQLNLLKADSNLVDRILDQLNLSEANRRRAKRDCGRTVGLTLFEILERLSQIYLQIRLNYDSPAGHTYKKRVFYKLNRLDLLNVRQVLDFIDGLKVKKTDDQYCRIGKSKIKEIFVLNSYELAEIDEFLKQNDLEFVWVHFFDWPHFFADPVSLIGKLKRLIDLQVSRELIDQNFYLLYHNVRKLDFLLAKFGSSFFGYPNLKSAFYKYEQIVKKAGELDEQQLKSYTFSQFMSEQIGP